MKIQVDWERYQTKDQMELLQELAKALQRENVIVDSNKFIDAIIQREQVASTIVTSNMAVPHICSTCVNQFHIRFVKLTEPLDSWDHQPGIDRFVIALLPKKITASDQQACKQFFSNLGKPTILNLFSRGSQPEVTKYLNEKRWSI